MVLTKVGVVPPGAGGARLELVDERAARRHRLLVYRFPGCELPPNLSRFEYNLSRRRTRTAPANGE